MGKKNSRFPGQRGMIHFMTLMAIAILLIGFVGYFSVVRLRGNSETSILGDSNTKVLSVETDLENELEFDSQGLDSIGNIDEDVTGIEFKSSPVPAASNSSYQDSEDREAGESAPLVLPDLGEGSPVGYKFLGLFKVDLSEESLLFRYLGFLFTK